MPAIKKRPSRGAKKRDFWGDEVEGQKLGRLIDRKFGSHFGSRKTALETLGLGRRLFNMYLTGERAVPEHLWSQLKLLPDFDQRTQATAPKRATRARAVPSVLFIDEDDEDPLS